MYRPRFPPIKCRWLIFAALAGLATAAVAGYWADGPRWPSIAFGPDSSLGFSRDSNELLTFHGLELGPKGELEPRIVRWDVATGRQLGVTPIVWEGPPVVASPGVPNRLYVTRIPGDERLLVGIQIPGPQSCVEYYVHDTATGRKTAGPFRSDRMVTDCSPDGRWCSAERDLMKGLAVVSVATGDTVLRLLPRSDSFPNSAAFSPDGNRAAVLWWPGDSTGNYHFVQIYDIPSGGKGRRLDLPPGRWQWIREWSADRLYAEVDHRRVYSFSLADDDFGTMHPNHC